MRMRVSLIGVASGAVLLGMVLMGAGAASAGTPRTANSMAKSASTSSYLTTAEPGGWGTSWSLSNLSPTFLGVLNSYSLLPLAMANPPKFGTYIPQIASSWKTTPSKITVHIRPNAKWQDGKPVTAKDVIDTLELQGTNGNGLWSQIDGLSSPSPHTVVLNIRKGQSAPLALYNVLGIEPLPASQYGKFVIPHLAQDLFKYFQMSATNPTAASKSAEGKTISKVFQKVEGFHPKTVIGDGPFKFVKATTQEILVKKWPGFWDAKKIHVPGVAFMAFAGNTNVYPALYNGTVDIAQTAMPYNITEHWKSTPGAHYITADNYAQFALYFNDRRYPFNNVKVRQAIAYMINRNQVNQVAEGGHSPYQTTKYPTGLLPTVQMQYITKSQLQSLNPYSYNPAKAASILKSLGFKKVKGHWIMPNGKPFVVDIGGPAGWNDSVADTIVMAREFNSFGIKATSTAVEQPGYWDYQHQGNFDLDWGWGGNGGLNPMAGVANGIGTNLNYSNIGAYANQKGIGFGPIENVAGLGKINVATTSAHEAAVTGPAQWKTLTWDWVKFMNQQLPYLPLCEKYQQMEYSTQKYTDYPAPSSHLWQLMGYNWQGGIVVAMERGMIRQK